MRPPATGQSLRVATALSAGWWLLLAILPLGHLTGVRNAWTIVVVVATLCWVRRDAWSGLPARFTLLALLLWCAASIGWSTSPDVSFSKWKSDLLLPLFAYAAAYGFVRRTGSLATIGGGLIAGLLVLAAISSFALLPSQDALGLRRAIPTDAFPNVTQAMPIWYPGVGDASMAASLAAGLFVFLRRIAGSIGRAAMAVGWLALIVVLLVANNRNAEIGIPLVLVACLWALRPRRASMPKSISGSMPGSMPSAAATRPVWLRRAALVVAVTIVATAVGWKLESGARERLDVLQIARVPGESAFVQLTSRDTRPMIWRYYTRLAWRSPWIGVGFGRTVPGIHYHTEDDRALAAVESNAYTHAHNLWLDWWLQTGLVGVLLLAAAIVEIVVTALRRARSAQTSPQPSARPSIHSAGLAIVAVVALMLIRDATDDFLVFGMATLFWTLAGALAAIASGAQSTEPRVR